MESEPHGRRVNYAKPLPSDAIEQSAHRQFVGGKWERLGRLQLRFLRKQGLAPEHRLLDVGCGALRAGIRFVGYLDPGNYYGVDINESLINAGYDFELSEELRAKLPRDHLRATSRFDMDFGIPFDYAIANSVFTHISLNHIRLCLYRLAKVMQPEGRFFATFFEAPEGFPIDEIVPGRRGGRFTEQNPFWYYQSDLEWAARGSPWEFTYIGDWGHPVGQQMAEFRRT